MPSLVLSTRRRRIRRVGTRRLSFISRSRGSNTGRRASATRTIRRDAIMRRTRFGRAVIAAAGQPPEMRWVDFVFTPTLWPSNWTDLNVIGQAVYDGGTFDLNSGIALLNYVGLGEQSGQRAGAEVVNKMVRVRFSVALGGSLESPVNLASWGVYRILFVWLPRIEGNITIGEVLQVNNGSGPPTQFEAQKNRAERSNFFVLYDKTYTLDGARGHIRHHDIQLDLKNRRSRYRLNEINHGGLYMIIFREASSSADDHYPTLSQATCRFFFTDP